MAKSPQVPLSLLHELKWPKAGLVIVPLSLGFDLKKAQGSLPECLIQALKDLVKSQRFKWEARSQISLESPGGPRILAYILPKEPSLYTLKSEARALMAKAEGTHKVGVSLYLGAAPAELYEGLTRAWLSTLIAAKARLPKYQTKDQSEPESQGEIQIFVAKSQVGGLSKVLDEEIILTTEENKLRVLGLRAPNDLSAQTFVRELKEGAKDWGLAFKHYSLDDLEKMGAGAFMAVAKASPKHGGGIVRLSYSPKSSTKKAAQPPSLGLVGKGVCFDTGGYNLKPARYMRHMNMDMMGAATALGLIRVASEQKWDFQVDAWLALVENHLSPDGTKPDEVVYALNGDSIEMVHTDAEGRMILADTLGLLAKESKPALVLDFATLTGSCVAAIGDRYTGVFSPNKEFRVPLIEAGETSGDRLWPFPMDEDLGSCLESKIADTLQCRLNGGIDHVEAALFLKRFVPKNTPWVHFDLSAASNTEGLAHVESMATGAGFRAAYSFIKVWAGTRP